MHAFFEIKERLTCLQQVSLSSESGGGDGGVGEGGRGGGNEDGGGCDQDQNQGQDGRYKRMAGDSAPQWA